MSDIPERPSLDGEEGIEVLVTSVAWASNDEGRRVLLVAYLRHGLRYAANTTLVSWLIWYIGCLTLRRGPAYERSR